jgi:hypothetical protein
LAPGSSGGRELTFKGLAPHGRLQRINTGESNLSPRQTKSDGDARLRVALLATGASKVFPPENWKFEKHLNAVGRVRRKDA